MKEMQKKLKEAEGKTGEKKRREMNLQRRRERKNNRNPREADRRSDRSSTQLQCHKIHK
jgi:hypothetical protein